MDPFDFLYLPRATENCDIKIVAGFHDKLAFYQTFAEPDGRTTEWLLFDGKKTPVVVLPLDECKQVIALSHFRYGANCVVWELPGGAIEEGQDAKEAIQNELHEECSHTVDDSKITQLHHSGVWFDPASVRVRFLPFLAIDCKEVQSLAKPGQCEHLVAKRFDIEEWYRGLATGRITDSKSFAVSMLALKYFDKESRKEARRGLGL